MEDRRICVECGKWFDPPYPSYDFEDLFCNKPCRAYYTGSKLKESEKLQKSVDEFLTNGGKIKKIPNGVAEWPDCMDSIVENRTQEYEQLIYIGRDIESVDNDGNLSKGGKKNNV